MSRAHHHAACIVVAALLLAPCARAEAPPPYSDAHTPSTPEFPDAEQEPVVTWALTLEHSLITTYAWRGDIFHDDRFEPATWNYVDLVLDFGAYGALDIGVWSSIPLRQQDSTVPEFDPYISYGVPVGPLTVNVLFWAFLQPAVALNGGDLGTGYTIVGTVSWNDLPITPTVGVAIDPFITHELYYYVEAAATLPGERFDLGFSSRLGISDGYRGGARARAGFQDWSTTLSATANLPRGFYTRLSGQFVYGGRPRRQVIPVAQLAIGYSHSPPR